MTNQAQKRHLYGYTLIELSITIMVIGLIVTVLANLYPKITESSAKKQSQIQSVNVEQTILGFIFANGRLPCPAANTNGFEDCSLEKGELPFRSLGLAVPIRNQSGIALRYAVYDKALTGTSDMALNTLQDRHAPFIATDDNSVSARPTAAHTVLNQNNPNGLDFCQALHNASNTNGDAANLHTGTGAVVKNYAYLLHDLGLEDADLNNALSDGSNTLTASDLNFTPTTQVANALNDDKVYVKSFDQLWDDLDCGSVISSIGHAHPNTATATAIMNQGLADYLVQVELGVLVAEADVAAAVAGILAGTSATAAAAATIPVATSLSINTAGAAAPTAGLSIAAVAAAAAGVVTAAIVTAAADTNLTSAKALVTDVNTRITAINALNTSVYANAIAADAAGIYQQ